MQENSTPKPITIKRVVYPGTFDPVTNGHLDILSRACKLFDEVIVGVAPNVGKGPLFPVEERIFFVEKSIAELGIDNARVQTFEGLLVDFAKSCNAMALVRGLRAVSDFEYEFQMTQMNRDLEPDLETIFLMPNADYFFTSSTIVKQVARYDPERIERFVPLHVAAALNRRYNHQ
jgi:pantetheine-phosphate adenylyltransferase